MSASDLVVGLSAVIVAVEEDAPYALVTRHEGGETGLPFGAFDPVEHRTFELGLREWVRAQTGFEPEYVEQLYTFGDQGRELPEADMADAPSDARIISVGYLGLTPERTSIGGAFDAVWRNWYSYFPWEDHRKGQPNIIPTVIDPGLRRWADENPHKLDRARLAFGLDGRPWIEERVLERYELLYEAGLAPEASRNQDNSTYPCIPGDAMLSDHRRILATAISRLRGKIKYRPVIFDLAPPSFTLSQLQQLVESVLGLPLHKQNFRRALDKTGLVEGTGQHTSSTGGRPAELYRFRQESLRQRDTLGVRAPLQKAVHG